MWQDDYLQRFYGSRFGWRDGTDEFHSMCEAYIESGAHILEIGPGPNNPTTRFLAEIGPVCGVDVDPEAGSNEALTTFARIHDGRLPFSDATFSACVSNYVLEHVSDATAHLSEVARVLGPRGTYVFRTPNRFHYVALVSAHTPHRVHKLLANRLRDLPPEAHDPYATFYRLNSRKEIREHARRAGLEVVELRMIEKEPRYAMAARPLFFAGMLYERLVNASDLLADLRSNVFGVLRKA